MGRFDSPIWKDPLIYLVLFAEFSVIPVMKQGPIDALFVIVFQFVVFGIVPTSIRKSRRERQAK